MSGGCIAYIVQDGEQLFLCVIDDAENKFHRFKVTVKGLARLASESAWAVNGAMDGYNPPLLEGRQVAQRVVK